MRHFEPDWMNRTRAMVNSVKPNAVSLTVSKAEMLDVIDYIDQLETEVERKQIEMNNPTMNSLPIWAILSFAFRLVQDAELASFRKDYSLARAWIQQSTGIWRMVVDYRDSGGILTDVEQKQLDRVGNFADRLSESMPPEPEEVE